MTRDMLVAIHAGAGIAALCVGLFVFPPTAAPGRRHYWRAGYAALLVILSGSLLALITVDWAQLAAGARIAFIGLAVLAAVMLTRLYLAHRLADAQGTYWRHRYVSHIYFTYISLWVGLGIVPALRTETPVLWVPVAITATLGIGGVLVHRYERRIGANTSN